MATWNCPGRSGAAGCNGLHLRFPDRNRPSTKLRAHTSSSGSSRLPRRVLIEKVGFIGSICGGGQEKAEYPAPSPDGEAAHRLVRVRLEDRAKGLRLGHDDHRPVLVAWERCIELSRGAAGQGLRRTTAYRT